jgi:hypothetical protein
MRFSALLDKKNKRSVGYSVLWVASSGHDRNGRNIDRGIQQQKTTTATTGKYVKGKTVV